MRLTGGFPCSRTSVPTRFPADALDDTIGLDDWRAFIGVGNRTDELEPWLGAHGVDVYPLRFASMSTVTAPVVAATSSGGLDRSRPLTLVDSSLDDLLEARLLLEGGGRYLALATYAQS